MNHFMVAQKTGRRNPALTLSKLDGQRRMAVIGDATHSVRRERELRQCRAWISSVVCGLTDSALLARDDLGRARDWNPGVERVTGGFRGSCLIAPLHPADEVPTEERACSLVIRDVSGRRAATGALRRAVACDHLTGLADRRALFEACELELQRWRRAPRPLSVVLIDADHFKRVDDDFGHAAVDVLIEPADRAVHAAKAAGRNC